MRPSRLVKRFVRWRPRADGPGLQPSPVYELWARLFTFEMRLMRAVRMMTMRKETT